MGTASGVVAALVAAVFAILVTAVRDQRSSTAAARHSQQVINAATEVRLDLMTGKNAAELNALLHRTLPALVKSDSEQLARVRRLAVPGDGVTRERLLD